MTKLTVRERFESHYEPEPMTGCWLWTASLFVHGGYGQFNLRAGKPVYAHRFSWELYRGPIPRGMYVLHRCDTPSCVNPDHLFLGTHQNNMDDMAAKGRSSNSKKTRCIRGHLFDEENTYRTSRGNRDCRLCMALRRERRRLG